MDNGFDIFVDRISENQREITYFLHDQFMSYPGVQCKIRFKIPFYYYRSWLCYLNPFKGDKIELCYIHGRIVTDSSGILDAKGRKKISGVMITDIKSIPLEAVHEIFSESIIIDKELKGK